MIFQKSYFIFVTPPTQRQHNLNLTSNVVGFATKMTFQNQTPPTKTQEKASKSPGGHLLTTTEHTMKNNNTKRKNNNKGSNNKPNNNNNGLKEIPINIYLPQPKQKQKTITAT